MVVVDGKYVPALEQRYGLVVEPYVLVLDDGLIVGFGHELAAVVKIIGGLGGFAVGGGDGFGDALAEQVVAVLGDGFVGLGLLRLLRLRRG